MSDPIAWYDTHAAEVSRCYESLAPNILHAWLIDLLPEPPAIVLDVGAGTGRDAAWLASRGYDVVAVEPSRAMRSEAQRLHQERSIRWLSDSLPALEHTFRAGLSFDLILLSAVWMHVPEGDRTRAFRKMITLLKPGGLLAITLRGGLPEPNRGIRPVSEAEIQHLARNHGAFIERAITSPDELNRKDVQWRNLAVRLPDDGTGALPLLRHIILNDEKASTYKLALLRVLCRIADGAAGYAKDSGDIHVAVPLGLVALYWVRLFKPLLAANLPQNPTNLGDQRLGFVKQGFRKLAEVSHLDLRIGLRFSADRWAALNSALRDACDTITKMPAHYMTYPNGQEILPVIPNRSIITGSAAGLDEVYFTGFGQMLVPRHLWRALQRHNAWIEPALVAEWARLMKMYGSRQSRKLDDTVIAEAMRWSEPSRDVRVARDQALRVLNKTKLHCVWTGRELSLLSLDIDHCFPWAAWPCDYLWNLLPAHRDVNQRHKRDRLPGDTVLRSAQERIQTWWDAGYLRSGNPILPEQFKVEAKASLPNLPSSEFELDDIFAALSLRRVRLKHDQQLQEWNP